MILTDTGPLGAILDKNDPHHRACLATAKRLPAGPLLTTWPCFTEAMYLLGEVGGYRYQAELWKLQQTGGLVLHDLTATEVTNVAMLMERYQDTPMDLADASLVAVAESGSFRRVFTLDGHFRNLSAGGWISAGDGALITLATQRSGINDANGNSGRGNDAKPGAQALAVVPQRRLDRSGERGVVRDV